LLTTSQLLDVYSLFLSIGVLYISYSLNQYTLNQPTLVVSDPTLSNGSNETCPYTADLRPTSQDILLCITAQIILAFSFNRLVHGISEVLLSKRVPIAFRYSQLYTTYMLFLLPIPFRLFAPTSDRHPNVIPALIAGFAGSELAVASAMMFSSLIEFFHDAYKRARVELLVYGLAGFVELHWQRLHVASIFQVFWITRVLIQYLFLIYVWHESSYRSTYFPPWEVFVDIIRTVLAHGCETVIALLGMTSVLSIVAHYMSEVVFWVLGARRDDDHEIGTMTAILFFLLAQQTGLTGMDVLTRLSRLYRNVCLLSMSVLHFMHDAVHTHMLALSTSVNVNISSHVRLVGVSLGLVSVAITLAVFLWINNSIGTWLLAVTAFCVELVVKTVVTLLIYSLFLIDSRRETMWEGLDDCIYWIRSTGSTIEYIFGMFLLCNGVWILVFESTGVLRAVMMFMHAYSNIFVQGRKGWKTFMLRRTAMRKIDRLAEATADQLAKYDNVCAICYQDLQSARITACRHMFHGVCLRKWLYVKDECPLCHQGIYAGGDPSDGAQPVNTGIQ